MSIKPKYVRKILSQEKKFEFRKRVFKNPKSDRIIIYASSPEQKLVARFPIKKILKDSPQNLWDICKYSAGIEKKEFFEYFYGKEVGYAIEISDLEIFSPKKDPHKYIPEFHAPQSFSYLENCPF